MPARSLYFVNWWFDALVVGGLSALVWIGLFKLMNQFEIRRRPGGAGAVAFAASRP